jgi:subtilase family serine protease
MSKHLLSRQIFALLAVLYLLTIPASARQQLHGHVPREANTSSYLGTMDTASTLNLAISLPLQNQDQLQQFLSAVYDEHSPLYHHFLTSDQFAQQFGPTDSDYQAVMDFAKAHNLTVTNTYSNHLLVDVQGSVSDIQKTFHVNLNRYRRRDGSEFHAPDQEPSVDLDVPVAHIGGLENHNLPKPSLFATKIDSSIRGINNFSSVNPNSGSGTANLYFGSDFRNIYLPCVLATTKGAGQTIALVEFDSYHGSDISTYATAAGYPAPLLTNISIDLFNTSQTPQSVGDDLEVSLDIEMAFAMAPSAQIDVYEEQNGGNADDLLNQIAIDNVAKQISCSWGPLGDAGTSIICNAYAAQGQSFFIAAGDTGSYIVGAPIAAVSDPMDLTSNMTVVGGTNLTTSGNNYTSEAVWNQSPGVAATKTPAPNAVSSGGFCSAAALPIPTYQIPFDSANSVSTQWRNIPDVSMVAQNIELIANNGTIFNSGGTSAASPLWAGLMALINETAAGQTKGPIGFANPYLYNLAVNNYSGNFNDVTTGNNDYWGNNPTFYQAGTGYDLATGLGSPKCALIAAIITPLTTNTVTPTPTVTRTPTITPTPTATFTVTNTPTPPTTNTSYAYPQPAHGGQVYLVYNSPIAQQVRINIYSLSGQEVDSVMDTPQASNANRLLISLQGFVPSVYFYVINGLSTGVLAKGKFLVVP